MRARNDASAAVSKMLARSERDKHSSIPILDGNFGASNESGNHVGLLGWTSSLNVA